MTVLKQPQENLDAIAEKIALEISWTGSVEEDLHSDVRREMYRVVVVQGTSDLATPHGKRGDMLWRSREVEGGRGCT
jgi:hypothetical protein